MLNNYQDLTIQYNSQGFINVDTSSFDYVVVQIVAPSTTINFLSSNDAGAITGATDGNATSAINFVTCQGVNQANGTAGSSTSSSNSMYEFDVIGRFLQLSGGAGSTVGKMLLMYSRIST